jgi:hypothetical protein
MHQPNQRTDSSVGKINSLLKLEQSFSNIINVNVNLENEGKASFTSFNRSIKKLSSSKEKNMQNKKNIMLISDASNPYYDKSIFSHINTTRAEGPSLSCLPVNSKQIRNFNRNLDKNTTNTKTNTSNTNNLNIKFNRSHKKTQSFNNQNLLYSTHTERLSSNSQISNDNNTNDINMNSKNLNKSLNKINNSIKNTNTPNKNSDNIKENEINKENDIKLVAQSAKNKSKSKSKILKLKNLKDLSDVNSLLAVKPGL